MRDMTVGSPHSHLWRYALPILLGNWLQLAYNAADAMIAGRFIGREALAAEGAAGPLMNLVILAISGVCIGAGVLMSESYGAKDWDTLRRTLATTVLSGLAVSLAVTAAGLVFAPALLARLDVPADIWGITCIYLRITFLGAPFTFLYNALAAGLKSVGDSKTPLLFLAFSSLLNIALDVVFIGFLGFGIVCSAVTTVVAQVVSTVLAAWYMLVKVRALCPRRGQWRIERRLLGRLLRYGGPTALQQAIQPVGKVLIQGQVNALGVNTIAAYNAVTRMDDFACIPEQGIAAAIATYIAQNRGAEKPERLRPGFAAGIRLEVGYWLLIGSVTLLLRAPIVSLFVTGEGTAEIVSLGSRYLGWMALFYLFPGLTNGFQGFYRGVGKMYTTMAGTAIQVTLRVLGTLWLAPRLGIVGIAFACAAGWSAMLLFEIPYYFVTCKRRGYPRRPTAQ